MLEFHENDHDHDDEGHVCDICNENDAIIFVKIIAEDGKTEEKGLCPSCAIGYLEKKDDFAGLSLVDDKLVDVIQEMKDLLSGIVNNISAISVFMSQNKNQTDHSCPNCGLEFDTFRESGYLGCPYCYHTFREYIEEFNFEMQRGSVHAGKMPARYVRLYVLKKEINFLKGKLSRLLHKENYEEAEKVKRKLQKLIGNHPSGSANAFD